MARIRCETAAFDRCWPAVASWAGKRTWAYQLYGDSTSRTIETGFTFSPSIGDPVGGSPSTEQGG